MLVQHARDRGFDVSTVEEFDMPSREGVYDVLVTSHIIEHFQYQDLIEFMESYLRSIKN